MRLGEYANEKQYPKPALVVLDLFLPGMSGMEFLIWAQGERAQNIPPIVILSYSSTELDRHLAEKFGAKAYFVKSPEPEETVATIKKALLASRPPSPPPGTSQIKNR